MSEQDLFDEMKGTIIDGDLEQAEVLAHQSLEDGIEPMQSVNKGFKAGLDMIGRGLE